MGDENEIQHGLTALDNITKPRYRWDKENKIKTLV